MTAVRRRTGTWFALATALIVVAATVALIQQPPVKGTSVPVPNPKMPWSIDGNSTSDWTYVIDLWLHDDALVVATEVDVVAYDRATGKPKWTVTPPANTSGTGRPLFCGASPMIRGNEIALAYGREKHDRIAACDHVTVLDLDTGTLGWHAKVSEPREGVNGLPTGALLDILGDTLIVGWDAYLVTYRLTDGTQLSKHGLLHNSSRPNCVVLDLIADKDLAYVSARCLGPDVPDLSVGTVDQSGTLRDVKDFTKATAGMTIQNGHFVSTSPPVLLAMDKEKSGTGAYLVLDSAFAIRTAIPVSPQNDLVLADLGTGVEVTTHLYYRTIVIDQTLITVTVPYPKKANKLVAYDLTTGQRRWETRAENARILTPVAVDGSSIISLADTGTQTTIRVNIANGNVESTTPHPRNGVTSTLHAYRFVWADNRIYAVRSRNVPVAPSLFVVG